MEHLASAPEAQEEETNAGDVSMKLVAEVAGAVADRDGPLIRHLFADLHPADAADLLEQLSYEQQELIAALAPDVLTGEVLAELAEDTRADFIEVLDPAHIAEAIMELDSDDMTMMVEELEPDVREQVLAGVPDAERERLESSLAFDEETAGRLMQREFVAAPLFWTVGDVIDHMRSKAEDLPDLFFEIFVVDESFRPIGVIAISHLLRAARSTRLEVLMEAPHVVIRPEDDQEEAAYLFEKYHLISAPVVDDAGRLTGMLTVDDMVDVIQEENKEDLLALAGVNDAGLADTVLSSVRSRAPWLFVNLLTAVVASGVIALFDQAISQLVALAVLMPIVASMGGNAGTQSLTVAVRALASRDLTSSNTRRVIWREVATGILNGLIFAIVMAIVAVIWFQSFDLAWVIAVSMVVNLSCAGLAGIAIPVALKHFGADPAVASSVFVTTVTDVVGFFVFLGLGAWVLLPNIG
ncbi:magnesium transporter [Woodsholea maritima]|uniref:magnesium transporter n=1 Tax=Woodsholea maritima TaxID=240237 RepID=UPI0003718E7C|nr:magnesium transporter [Woodsholea maritima]